MAPRLPASGRVSTLAPSRRMLMPWALVKAARKSPRSAPPGSTVKIEAGAVGVDLGPGGGLDREAAGARKFDLERGLLAVLDLPAAILEQEAQLLLAGEGPDGEHRAVRRDGLDHAAALHRGERPAFRLLLLGRRPRRAAPRREGQPSHNATSKGSFSAPARHYLSEARTDRAGFGCTRLGPHPAPAHSAGAAARPVSGKGMRRRRPSEKRPSIRMLKERPPVESAPWNWLTVSNQALWPWT